MSQNRDDCLFLSAEDHRVMHPCPSASIQAPCMSAAHPKVTELQLAGVGVCIFVNYAEPKEQEALGKENGV